MKIMNVLPKKSANRKFVSLLKAAMMLLAVTSMSKAETIAPRDFLKISVEGIHKEEVAKINAVYPVSKNGTINMPFVGIVKVAGKEPAKLQQDLAEKYKKTKIYPNSKTKVEQTEKPKPL